MGIYDLKRLDVALQYIRRMAGGRNPVTNRPAPENEVLTNANVNRCLTFVEEILLDVKSAGGVVGKVPRTSREPGPGIDQTFPYEILQEYRYEEDLQISWFLGQLGRALPQEQKMPVPATTITNWLRENGYLEKRMMEDTGKENSVPTEKGKELGMYAEKAGFPPNEYYRVYYNARAQQFLVDNFRKILTESEEMKRKRRSERRRQRKAEADASLQAAQVPSFEEDPDFRSLLAGIPDVLDPSEEAGLFSASGYTGEGSASGYTGEGAVSGYTGEGSASGYMGEESVSGYTGEESVSGFTGDGWESAEEGLPW